MSSALIQSSIPNTQILLMGSIILPKLKSIFYLHNKPSGLLVSRSLAS